MLPKNLKGDALHRFIGGRRRYNSQRKMAAIGRRWQLLFHWAKNPHLNKADLARYFGVSRATISRDIAILKQQDREGRHKQCPMCEGKGRIDTGPGVTVVAEVISDIKRSWPNLFEGE